MKRSSVLAASLVFVAFVFCHLSSSVAQAPPAPTGSKSPTPVEAVTVYSVGWAMNAKDFSVQLQSEKDGKKASFGLGEFPSSVSKSQLSSGINLALQMRKLKGDANKLATEIKKQMDEQIAEREAKKAADARKKRIEKIADDTGFNTRQVEFLMTEFDGIRKAVSDNNKLLGQIRNQLASQVTSTPTPTGTIVSGGTPLNGMPSTPMPTVYTNGSNCVGSCQVVYRRR